MLRGPRSAQHYRHASYPPTSRSGLKDCEVGLRQGGRAKSAGLSRGNRGRASNVSQERFREN